MGESRRSMATLKIARVRNEPVWTLPRDRTIDVGDAQRVGDSGQGHVGRGEGRLDQHLTAFPRGINREAETRSDSAWRSAIRPPGAWTEHGIAAETAARHGQFPLGIPVRDVSGRPRDATSMTTHVSAPLWRLRPDDRGGAGGRRAVRGEDERPRTEARTTPATAGYTVPAVGGTVSTPAWDRSAAARLTLPSTKPNAEGGILSGPWGGLLPTVPEPLASRDGGVVPQAGYGIVNRDAVRPQSAWTTNSSSAPPPVAGGVLAAEAASAATSLLRSVAPLPSGGGVHAARSGPSGIGGVAQLGGHAAAALAHPMTERPASSVDPRRAVALPDPSEAPFGVHAAENRARSAQADQRSRPVALRVPLSRGTLGPAPLLRSIVDAEAARTAYEALRPGAALEGAVDSASTMPLGLGGGLGGAGLHSASTPAEARQLMLNQRRPAGEGERPIPGGGGGSVRLPSAVEAGRRGGGLLGFVETLGRTLAGVVSGPPRASAALTVSSALAAPLGTAPAGAGGGDPSAGAGGTRAMLGTAAEIGGKVRGGAWADHPPLRPSLPRADGGREGRGAEGGGILQWLVAAVTGAAFPSLSAWVEPEDMRARTDGSGLVQARPPTTQADGQVLLNLGRVTTGEKGRRAQWSTGSGTMVETRPTVGWWTAADSQGGVGWPLPVRGPLELLSAAAVPTHYAAPAAVQKAAVEAGTGFGLAASARRAQMDRMSSEDRARRDAPTAAVGVISGGGIAATAGGERSALPFARPRLHVLGPQPTPMHLVAGGIVAAEAQVPILGVDRRVVR